jgi:hypothetical protein
VSVTNASFSALDAVAETVFLRGCQTAPRTAVESAARAKVPRELDRSDADAGRSCVHEDVIAALELGELDEREVRGEPRLGDAGRLDVRKVRRLSNQVRRWRDDVLCVRALVPMK